MSLKTQIDAFEVQKKANVPADILNLMDVTTEKLIAEQFAVAADRRNTFRRTDGKSSIRAHGYDHAFII